MAAGLTLEFEGREPIEAYAALIDRLARRLQEVVIARS